jgi:PPOX class probable F420-dependent enzyme
MLTETQRYFLNQARVARLATMGRDAQPHLVPVCFCLGQNSVYVTVDEKPKRTDIPLKRIRNIQENPSVAITIDRWDEDWTRLAWIMLRGRADILPDGEEHDRAQHGLTRRYPQYQGMNLAPLPVIAIRIQRVLSWGALD